jgi:hypothetical protein
MTPVPQAEDRRFAYVDPSKALFFRFPCSQEFWKDGQDWAVFGDDRIEGFGGDPARSFCFGMSVFAAGQRVRASGRKRLKSVRFRIVGAVVLVALLIYAGDYFSVRYKIPKGRDPFSTVTIQPYYAIHEKNGRTEYDFAQPQTQVCVRSLFPHFGYAPCWYVNRHTDKRIDI